MEGKPKPSDQMPEEGPDETIPHGQENRDPDETEPSDVEGDPATGNPTDDPERRD